MEAVGKQKQLEGMELSTMVMRGRMGLGLNCCIEQFQKRDSIHKRVLGFMALNLGEMKIILLTLGTC
jgi:hypothetical protein